MTAPGAASQERARFGPGIYVHYPFCRSRCGYCDFFVVLADRPARTQFFGSLLGEVDLAAADPLWEAQRFQTIFLGGGTPSLLSVEEIAALLGRLRDRFDIAAGAEITMECNPESLRLEAIRGYRDAGVNRISLGVQSMDPEELALLDRAHGVEEVARRVKELREGGVASFNLDLIYGLPRNSDGRLGSDDRLRGSTGVGAESGDGRHASSDARFRSRDESWRETLERTLALEPPHLSAYLLSLEPHVPLARRMERGELTSPADESAVAQYEELRARAERHGLMQYEISNFARPGQESRHNQNYWLRGDYLGLGPSAHSHREGYRWSNLRSLPAYRERIATGTLPREGEMEQLDARAAAEEWLFLGLRRTEGIAWNVLEESGLPLGGLEDAATKLAREGWLVWEGGRLRLDPRAYFISNTVFAELAAAL